VRWSAAPSAIALMSSAAGWPSPHRWSAVSAKPGRRARPELHEPVVRSSACGRNPVARRARESRSRRAAARAGRPISAAVARAARNSTTAGHRQRAEQRRSSLGDRSLVAFINTGITNARTESANRMVQDAARIAFGFRNLHNQRRRVRLHCKRTVISQPLRG
jgi:Transposase